MLVPRKVTFLSNIEVGTSVLLKPRCGTQGKPGEKRSKMEKLEDGNSSKDSHPGNANWECHFRKS